jgi:SAM-dependent methyltransferase
MLSRRMKEAFYILTGPVMLVNGFLYRQFRAPRTGHVRVHLGPGVDKYLDGWINVDAHKLTGKCDVWADLRNKLPFPDSSIDAIYSHHMIEHLPDLEFHWREIHRCLKPGGTFRIAGPNGDAAMRKYGNAKIYRERFGVVVRYILWKLHPGGSAGVLRTYSCFQRYHAD